MAYQYELISFYLLISPIKNRKLPLILKILWLLNFKLKMAKRSYNEALLKLGFTELDGKPKCIVYLKVLFAESMKKNKLKHHLETNQPNCSHKSVRFFQGKVNSIQGQRNFMTKFTTKNKLAVYFLYIASYQTAKQKKLVQLVRTC